MMLGGLEATPPKRGYSEKFPTVYQQNFIY